MGALSRRFRLPPSFPPSTPVIPAKAGIQRRAGMVGVAREAALARVTPILAFPHKGGRDPLTAIRA